MIVFASGLSLTAGQAEAKKGTVVLDDSERIAALVELGKEVFFDPISKPKGKQSCSSCHDPVSGWTGPTSDTNLVEVAQPGADIHKDPGARGGLKPPTNAYATLIPPFATAAGPVPAFGGTFWNGRAEGADPQFPEGATAHIFLEDVIKANDSQGFKAAVMKFIGPVADQALNPFPNPVEQNIREKAACQQVNKADYAHLFTDAWGERIKCDQNNYSTSFKRIAVALAAYQDSPEVNSFSSKRDNALRDELACMSAQDIQALPWVQRLEEGESVESVLSRFGLALDDLETCADGLPDATPGQFPLAGLSPQENWGHDLFYANSVQFGPPRPLPIQPGAFATCDAAGNTFPDGIELTEARLGAGCSLCHSNNPGADNGSEPLQTYADHGYHNIGTPVNFEIPGNVASDIGLAGHTGNDGHIGQVKAPTLRNVDKRPSPNFVKAYASNGWFKSLESIVHFYNTSFVKTADNNVNHSVTRCPDGVTTEAEAIALGDDGLPACWPAPGHDNGVSFNAAGSVGRLTGNLGLSTCDEEALVAYLKTLTDEAVVELP
ncbi:hypothetical protein GCM10022394_21490 [Zobellella aerophila]|uniref:Cytochrome c domain-containing protein n=2 Tax=Zobellella aerophila TaxID=870480 RepID=A0ABP6VVZ6_9GAMM